MALQFILGGSGRGKTECIHKMILEHSAENIHKEHIIIVPEQFTMQTQKDLVKGSPMGGIINIDVQSFVRLAFRVFAETGSGNEPVLDDLGKTMILKKVLLNNRDKLQYFGRNIHKMGYVQEIKSFLSELMQYDVDGDKLDKMIDAAEGKSVLVNKLEDMSVAYEAFLDYIDKNYITSEEVLTVFADVVKKSDILAGCNIYMDGFTGFTPLQYRIIKELLQVADNVYITLTISEGESVINIGEKHRLFYMSRKTMHTLRDMAREGGARVMDDIWVGTKLSETRFAESEQLSLLEKNIFRFPYDRYDGKVQDISVHELEQPDGEASYVVEEISRLLRNENCRYKDIAVIVGNMDEYGMLVDAAMKQANIPCFIDRKKGIVGNPFVILINSLMDIMIRDFAYEDVMKFLKSGMTDIPSDEMNILDNFLVAAGIRGHKKWGEEWKCEYVFSRYTEESVLFVTDCINSLREKLCEILLPVYDTIASGKHSVREYATCLCKFLEEYKYYEKLMVMSEKFKAEMQPELASEFEQIYGIVIGVFNRLVELLGDEQMDISEFREILDTGFREARIGLIPPGVDQIVVGDLSRTRINNVKYLFLMGVNGCNIPGSGNGGGILSEADRTFLEQQKFELAPSSRELVYTEQFYLYLALTKPSKHLYMTYCNVGVDGKSREPSYIIERVERLFPKLRVQVEESRDDVVHALSNDMGKRYLIQSLRKRNYSDTAWQELFKYYKKDNKESAVLEKIVDAAFYRETESSISKEAAHRLYRHVLRGSTSQFEKYAACAFSYFMKYGLKLEERKEHTVEFFDIGNIVHEAIQLYTERLIREGKKWQDISESEQHIRANLCINEVVEKYKNGLMYSTERDTYLISRLRNLMTRSIWAITKQMEAGDFETLESEFSFSVADENTVSQDDMLQIIGRVDRIDVLEKDGKKFVNIVDYKTGKKDMSLSDLYHGLQMQLIIYLKAGVDSLSEGRETSIVVPAGVFYYNIDDPVLEKEKLSGNDMEKELLMELRMRGLANEDDPILPALDNGYSDDDGTRADFKSKVAYFSTDKKGSLKKTSATITTEQFQKLIDYTEKNIAKMGSEIMEGTTTVNPYKKDDSSQATACDYCPYGGICRFDTKIQGNSYRRVHKMSDDDVFVCIEKELNPSPKSED